MDLFFSKLCLLRREGDKIHTYLLFHIYYTVTGRFAHGPFARGQFAHGQFAQRTIRPRIIRPTDNSPNGQFAHKYCFFVKKNRIYGLTVKKYNTLCADNFNQEKMI